MDGEHRSLGKCEPFPFRGVKRRTEGCSSSGACSRSRNINWALALLQQLKSLNPRLPFLLQEPIWDPKC